MREDRINLKEKARWVRAETLRLHGLAPETRVASSLSPIELLVALHYGGVMEFRPDNPKWENRDRLILSKGHGTISYYPILADLGYFPIAELDTICKEGSFLGGIPDTLIPGYETINGSLGHGLGVACGMALALRRRNNQATLFVLMGDGELNEGSVWEAVMFAAHHLLGSVIAIVDNNRICMLDHCKKILDLEPIEQRFLAFGWNAVRVDGHAPDAIAKLLSDIKGHINSKPTVVIADTIKGKGVPLLEQDPLCHVRSLTIQEIAEAMETLYE